MAKIETKYNIGDTVFCFDRHFKVVSRKVKGIRTQVFENGSQKTMYSFLKDNQDEADYLGYFPAKEKFFWIAEENLSATIEELKNKI